MGLLINGATSISLTSADVPPVDNVDHSKSLRGYRVVLDDEFDIFDTYDPTLFLIEPVLELEINTAGSFEFIMPPNHRYYDKIQPYSCIIEVYEDAIQHWVGRPISVEVDYYKQKRVYCEGALNFLKDAIIKPGSGWVLWNADSIQPYETDDDREIDQRVTTTAKHALEALLQFSIKKFIGYNPTSNMAANNRPGFLIRKNSPYLDSQIKMIKASPSNLGESGVIEQTPRSLIDNSYVNDEWYSIGTFHYQLFADSMKDVKVGYVTIDDTLTGDESKLTAEGYSTALDTFNSVLLDYFGGYIFVSREFSRDPDDGGVTEYSTGITRNFRKYIYMDWYKDMPYKCNQTIEFGLNLIDFQSQFNGENFATSIIAYNGKEDDGGRKVNIVYTSDAKTLYGTIEKAVEFPSAETTDELTSLAKQYLEDTQFNASVIECTAADIHPINENYEPFRIGQTIHCRSVPHLVDKEFPLTKMTIELNKDEGSKQITLGTKPRETLTKVVNNKKYWVGSKAQYEKATKDGSSEIYFVTE